jgi:nucleoside-diphosphate-sugar epimerase
MYDEAKRYGEAITTVFHKEHCVDARIVRIFNTYGPRSDPNDGRLIPNFVAQALTGRPMTLYGNGQQTRSLCYVSDLVEGLFRVMEHDATGGEVINLGNPDEHTIYEFADMIRSLTGSTSEFIFTDHAVGDDPQRRRPDISKASGLLGWQPQVGLTEGLGKTIEYFRTEMALEEAHA